MSRPGPLSYRPSSVFVGLNIINLLKDSMKLKQTCIYLVTTNTEDTPKDKKGEWQTVG